MRQHRSRARLLLSHRLRSQRPQYSVTALMGLIAAVACVLKWPSLLYPVAFFAAPGALFLLGLSVAESVALPLILVLASTRPM